VHRVFGARLVAAYLYDGKPVGIEVKLYCENGYGRSDADAERSVVAADD
jgi:hypothetical protein